jgi:hypothetical protein
VGASLLFPDAFFLPPPFLTMACWEMGAVYQ